MARKSGRGRTAALARRHNTSMRRGNTGSTEYIDHKTATNTKNLSNTYGSQGTNCTGTPIETSTIPSGMKEEDQNRRTERDRLQRFDNERIDSVKSSFSQEANYDGCDDGPDFSDEGYNSPGSASSQACWHRSLTWWKEFIASREGGVADKCLEKNRPPPAVSILKKFLVYIVQRPNRLQRARGIRTLRTYFKHFCSAFHKATGTVIPWEARAVITQFISKLPQSYDVPKTQREKYIFAESDLDNLLRVMWTTDCCTFVHERQRVQLSLFLLIHAFCGARASTWIESSLERGTNRCLTYKDVGLHVCWDESGQKGLLMELTQRYTKGNRDVDNNWFRVSMQSRERLFRDPVAFFLALAFADDAIKGVSSIEQFWSVQPRRGQKSFQFEWNEDKLDVPVFRVVTATGPTPASWTCSSMFHYLDTVTRNAGYKAGSITIHTIRRGAANLIDKMASPAERNQILGWASSDIYGRHYISRVSGVDGQAAFLHESPRTNHIEMLRSAGRVQNPGIPQRLSAKAADTFINTPEMKATSGKLEELASDGATAEKDKRRVWNDRGRLRREALSRYQAQWLQDDYFLGVARQDNEIETAGSSMETSLTPNEHEFNLLRPFIPERSRIAELANTILPCYSSDQRSAIEDLTSLCSRVDHRVFYRPDEMPIGGRCPVDGCQIDVEACVFISSYQLLTEPLDH